jgi:glyoxylase-like metal-dependent hydrolase (beta-lactamase superfamily II)
MRLSYTEAEGGLEVAKLEVGNFENNVYVLRDTAANEAYVVDGGYEPEAIKEAVGDATVRGILITHGHRDHHEHVRELRALLDAPVGVGAEDAPMLEVHDFTIADGDRLRFGAHELVALRTPGHTPGSTCFLLPGRRDPKRSAGIAWVPRVFTGDTLFPGGPGNTDKDPVRFARIIRSLRERLFTLPDATTVCPGHGRDTTIGAERPSLDAWVARGW